MGRKRTTSPPDPAYDHRARELAARHGIEATASRRGDGLHTLALHGLDDAQMEKILGAMASYGAMLFGG